MNRDLKTLVANVAYSSIGNRVVTLFGVANLYTKIKVFSTKKRDLRIAKKEFEKGSGLGNFEDYKQALDKHWVSYNEYAYKYELYCKPEKEREEYVSRLKMASFYWRYTPGIAKSVFRNKTKFLKTFNKYIYRKWLYAPESSFEEFSHLVTNYDCIVKPCDGKLGKGVYKIYKDADHKEDRKLFESCVKGRMLVEQCIESCDELRAFHPQSLNTIRVVTIANKEKACVFSGVFRTGGMIFKGFKIPQWDTIVETCCEAAKQNDNPITGWDVVINSQEKVEFVEANYGPDMDMMQTRYNAGAKKKIYALIKEYCGIELK